MKILFLSPGFPVGGAEIFLIDLVNNLERTRFQPSIISLSRQTDLEKTIKPGIPFYRYERKYKYDFTPLKSIRNLIKKESFSTIFVLDLFAFFYLKLALRKEIINYKIIISLHSTTPRSLKDFLQKLFYPRFFNGKEKLIAVCNNQADYLAKMNFINKKQFSVIYNGIDPEQYLMPENFNKEVLKNEYNIPPDSIIIIQVAVFRKEKNHKDSVLALENLHKSSSYKPFLLLVGGGSKEIQDEIRKLSSDKGLANYVIFAGEINDVRPYYWSADFFTLSSRSGETFSRAALEAMASGLPCVLTNISGASEMIFEEINGYLAPAGKPVELAEKWKKTLDNKKKFSREKIRQIIIDKFSLEQNIEQYQNLFEITNRGILN
jgi:glycosyltransferase involved in cell wall biosynthesis